jgi:Glyoxalase/Bleomycin resistance protein/Dioxygenase superfamily.
MICHVTVQTENLQGSVDFYSWLLGLPVSRRFEFQNGEIAFLGDEETKLEFIFNQGYQKSGTAQGISIGFSVNSLEEKMALLDEKEIIHTPVLSPNPHTRFCYFTDLNGIKIQLMEVK